MTEIAPIKLDSRRWTWITVGSILVGLAAIGRIGMIAWPFLNDSGLYAYMGKMVSEGGVLYRDFYENKLPGVGLITSAFWRAFGGFWPGYVLSQLALALLGAGVLARMARRHGRPGTALPTFLYGAVFLNFCWAVFTGFQLEPIQAFFETLAAAAALEAISSDNLADAFAAGLAAGAAAMLKPSGVAVLGAFVFIVFLRSGWKRSAKHGLAAAAGAAIPTGVTIIYAWRATLFPYLPQVLWQIRMYADGTPWEPFMLVKIVVVCFVLGFPFLLRMVPFRSEKTSAQRNPGAIFSFAVAWFIVDLIGVISQRRMYLYHFLPLVCPAALLYGMFPRPARATPVFIGLFLIDLLSLQWHGSDPLHLNRGWQRDPVSEYVSAHTTSSDFVYTDQIGRLLIETGLRPGSRYGTFFYFINYDTAPLDYCHAMLSDFQQRKPKYIVIGQDATADRQHPHESVLALSPLRFQNFLKAGRQLDEYLAQNYVVETVIEGNNVYRRKDLAPPLAAVPGD